MSILLDTTVLYAEHDTSADRHTVAARSVEAVFTGQYGQPYISDYVLDEAITMMRVRSRRFEPAYELGKRLRGDDPYPAVYHLLRVTPPVLEDAWTVFQQFSDHELSLTDATSVSLMDHHDIDSILTFDTDFDGIAERTDPTTITTE